MAKITRIYIYVCIRKIIYNEIMTYENLRTKLDTTQITEITYAHVFQKYVITNRMRRIVNVHKWRKCNFLILYQRTRAMECE